MTENLFLACVAGLLLIWLVFSFKAAIVALVALFIIFNF